MVKLKQTFESMYELLNFYLNQILFKNILPQEHIIIWYEMKDYMPSRDLHHICYTD